MVKLESSHLKPLIESSKGLHFTAYVINTGRIRSIQKQIRIAVQAAEMQLREVLSVEETARFLAPVRHLMRDREMLKRFRQNLGIFRNQDSFRVLNVPVQVESLCSVATTFHVKPLLKWLQTDKEFFLIGFEPGIVSLYRGNQASLDHVDSLIFHEGWGSPFDLPAGGQGDNAHQVPFWLQETLAWFHDWNRQFGAPGDRKLYMAGNRDLCNEFSLFLNEPWVCKKPLSEQFRRDQAVTLAVQIRDQIREDLKRSLQESLMEFAWAENINLGKKDLFKIAEAAVEGRVRKLLIADGVQIWGKIHPSTGQVALHPRDLDHEDDDILDDLAQAVLAAGGEVVVVPKSEIPRGHSALAILVPRIELPRWKSAKNEIEVLIQ